MIGLDLKKDKHKLEKHQGKLSSRQNKMPSIACSYGEQNLVVPDVAAMNKAIKNHISKHKTDEEFLIEQALKAANQSYSAQ